MATNGGYVAIGSEPLSPPLTAKNLNNSLLRISSDGTYSYSYGPQGIKGLLTNYYAFLCAIFASIGGLSFGYDQGVIANVLVMRDFVQRWPVTPLQKGIMTAVLELGALVGALCAGIFADKFSRRHSIFVACVIFCIGGAFQAGAQSLAHIFIGRAIGGLGVGAVRGSLMALEQLAIMFIWCNFFSTFAVPSSYSWRIPLFALGCLILPASPRLMVLHGRHDDALRSLARLRLRTEEESRTDPIIQIELLEMRVEAMIIQRTFDDRGTKVDCFQYKYRDRTMVAVLVMVFQQWTGINTLLYFGPTVALLVSGGIGIVQFIAVIPAILYIDTWGRKPLLRGKQCLTFKSHRFFFSDFSNLFQVLQFSSDWTSHPIAAVGAVGSIYVFTFAYGISFGPIGWVLPAEVFPLSMRSKGVSVATASNWINNFLIGLLTPVMIDYSTSGTFLVFATACFLAYFWASRIPETANVSLEEIDKMFRSSAGAEDAILKHQIEREVGLTEFIATLRREETLE
ncbi:hypothetical protein C8J56DRAFT_972215 [Mycena floridula]|nr:hypothetical protein C8J56DRAFT_972215 [Mycena floridula]